MECSVNIVNYPFNEKQSEKLSQIGRKNRNYDEKKKIVLKLFSKLC